MTLRDDMLARRDATRHRANRHERRKRKALGLSEARPEPQDDIPADADRYWMLRLIHPSHRAVRLEMKHD